MILEESSKRSDAISVTLWRLASDKSPRRGNLMSRYRAHKLPGNYSRWSRDIITVEEQFGRWIPDTFARLDDIVGRLAAIMTGTGQQKWKWKSVGQHRLRYGRVAWRNERNRPAQCANATHCSTLQKLSLVTKANNGSPWPLSTDTRRRENYSGRSIGPFGSVTRQESTN